MRGDQHSAIARALASIPDEIRFSYRYRRDPEAPVEQPEQVEDPEVMSVASHPAQRTLFEMENA